MSSLETSSFWTPLLLCVAVSSVFALLVLYYFKQQINSLDHKINSMFSLITSITNELNRLTMIQATSNDIYTENNVDDIVNTNIDTNIDSYLNQIIVSDDDEEESGDDEEESGDDEDESGDEEDEESDDDEDEESGDALGQAENGDDEDEESGDEDEEYQTIQIIGEQQKINLGEEVIDNTDNLSTENIKFIELTNDDEDDDEDDEDEDDEDDEDDDDDDEEIEHIQLVSDTKDFSIINELANIEGLPNLEELTNLEELPNLEELSNDELSPSTNKNIEIIDYKKLPVKQLKELVVQKGLVQNANKLSKNKLIKLLEGN